MNEPFGSPGQKPGSPGEAPSDPPGHLKDKAQDTDDSGTPLMNFMRKSREPDEGNVQDQDKRELVSVELKYIDPRKRVVALVFDFIACYLAGVVLVMLPFVGRFISLRTSVLLLFLGRDYLFQGRGIGKNLMGLQVVDIYTGAPCSLTQSIIRNIVLVAPIVVLEIMSAALSFVQIDWIFEVIVKILNIIGMIYVAIVLPTECYRAYSRKDSLRKGDEIAKTAVVEAPMDFGTIFPR